MLWHGGNGGRREREREEVKLLAGADEGKIRDNEETRRGEKWEKIQQRTR